MRLIDADALNFKELKYEPYPELAAKEIVNDAPTIDAVPVTAAELKHLINDTIAYIWRMEDSGTDKPEFGYDSRKALLEKLKQFEKEHFPESDCACCGERKENTDGNMV